MKFWKYFVVYSLVFLGLPSVLKYLDYSQFTIVVLSLLVINIAVSTSSGYVYAKRNHEGDGWLMLLMAAMFTVSCFTVYNPSLIHFLIAYVASFRIGVNVGILGKTKVLTNK